MATVERYPSKRILSGVFLLITALHVAVLSDIDPIIEKRSPAIARRTVSLNLKNAWQPPVPDSATAEKPAAVTSESAAIEAPPLETASTSAARHPAEQPESPPSIVESQAVQATPAPAAPKAAPEPDPVPAAPLDNEQYTEIAAIVPEVDEPSHSDQRHSNQQLQTTNSQNNSTDVKVPSFQRKPGSIQDRSWNPDSTEITGVDTRIPAIENPDTRKKLSSPQKPESTVVASLEEQTNILGASQPAASKREEKPAPPTPPPAEKPQINWNAMIGDFMSGIDTQAVYPLAARRRRQQGTVVVRLTLSTEGQVSEIRLDRSSRFAMLDKAALKLINRRSDLLEKMIADSGTRPGKQIQLSLPIQFRLR